MVNPIPLIWDDLIDIERSILTVMAWGKRPFAFWQLYTSASWQLYTWSKYKKNKDGSFFIPANEAEINLDLVKKDLSDNVNWEFIRILRKQGVKLPSNRRFLAILKDMEAAGWVKHRNVSKTTFFLLTDYAKPIADKNTLVIEVQRSKKKGTSIIKHV